MLPLLLLFRLRARNRAEEEGFNDGVVGSGTRKALPKQMLHLKSKIKSRSVLRNSWMIFMAVAGQLLVSPCRLTSRKVNEVAKWRDAKHNILALHVEADPSRYCRCCVLLFVDDWVRCCDCE